MIIEEGLSNKSFLIFGTSLLLAMAALFTCLEISPGQPWWLQLIEALGTLTLFGISFAAWIGKFDKKVKQYKPVTDTLLREILLDRWGRGGTRMAKLDAAGYDPYDVQEKLNAAIIDGRLEHDPRKE